MNRATEDANSECYYLSPANVPVTELIKVRQFTLIQSDKAHCMGTHHGV